MVFYYIQPFLRNQVRNSLGTTLLCNSTSFHVLAAPPENGRNTWPFSTYFPIIIANLTLLNLTLPDLTNLT